MKYDLKTLLCRTIVRALLKIALFFNIDSLKRKKPAFSLVEILVALIIISLIAAALVPVITKKLSSAGVTIFGGGSGGIDAGTHRCPSGLYLDIENKTCEICPAGFFCDGVNRIPCAPGTFSNNRQSECTPCQDGFYALEGATQCLENTALNCEERSKEDNVCLTCPDEHVLANGDCVSNVPIYKLMNGSGDDITESGTEFSRDENYWQIKIKASGTLSFTSTPSNLVDVFLVGGGGGGKYSSDGCGSAAAGGGNYNIVKNVLIAPDITYPITIGAGGARTKCSIGNGGTTSGFGIFSHGGVNQGSHSICPFDESDCTLKYGETGTSSNQIANTGNGGAAAAAGMSGVIIIRGTMNPRNINSSLIPTYKFINSVGSETTTTDTTLNITDDYWYIKYNTSGTTSFSDLPSNLVDVFVVGGGGGGQFTSSGCGNSAAGGGNYNTIKNVVINKETTYPITIGTGGAKTECSTSVGGTTSGFGIFSYGGVNQGSHSICPFGDSSCEFKYGNVGTDTNQNHNTGNGGTAAKAGMSGTIIIRGLIDPKNFSLGTIPTYKFFNSTGFETTVKDTILNVTDDYWYIKYNASGTTSFSYLPNNLVDVFVVGGGAGGQYTSGGCGNSAAGGGNYNTIKNVVINKETTYPIVIGTGGARTKCGFSDGGTSSAFGLFSYGGVNQGSHSICPFGDSSCEFKYGNVGTDTNQNHNTGNGGTAAKAGMSGTVIIRGKRVIDDSSLNVPIYRFFNSPGINETTTYTTMNIVDDYWYIKYNASGTTSFDYLPNNLVDVFVVGGGAGGQYTSSGCGSYAAGGGTYSILRDTYLSSEKSYPIVIGSGGAATQCSIPDGVTSSGFGAYSRGGLNKVGYGICPFGVASCEFKYGNVGTDTNQNHNTGNGGTEKKKGMNGVVMIRGKVGAKFDKVNKLPTYTLTNSTNLDITYAGASLAITNTHWYLKIVQSGDLKFDTINNDKVDVFLVGGGAGGQYTSSGCGNSAGGGGNYNILRDVAVNAGEKYSIAIGAGGAKKQCGILAGGTTSAFDNSAAGGSSTTSHSVCLFNETDCTVTYGNLGSETNQFQNTGNGGYAGKNGMNGVVIIRGTL